jgi:predicted dehydrogenase
VRLGFISFAHMHAASYAACARSLPNVELVGIADDDPRRGRAMAAKYATRYMRDVKSLLAESPDAVIVTSENSRHAGHVTAAAEAGTHVMCEKPVAATLADARRMVDACRRAGVILQTAFPMRFSPPVIRAKQMHDEGKIGRVLAANTTNHGRMPGGWFVDRRLSGGGAVMDHTVHVADLLRWILADEVAEVYAEAGRFIHPHLKCEDCGVLSMKFRRGAIATLDASWSRLPSFPTWGDVTLRLWGEKGTITADAFCQQVDVHANRHWYAGWGSNADLGLVGDFIESVATGRKASVTGVDGLRALEVALAAYRSIRTGKPVHLPSAG